MGATRIELTLSPDMLASLDKFCADQGAIGRQEGIGILLRDGLINADALPADQSQNSRIRSPQEIETDHGMRPEDLNAENDG